MLASFVSQMIKIINNKNVSAVNRVVRAWCNYIKLLVKSKQMPELS